VTPPCPRHDTLRSLGRIKICPSAGTTYGNSYYMEYLPKGIFKTCLHNGSCHVSGVNVGIQIILGVTEAT
jgi:hypothetical protein